jgi:OFA family oxalate/formate antiporter-like MFS transporter
MPPSNSSASVLPAPTANRWLQLFVGVVCMVMIANLQYGWTLFVQPIDQKFGWGRPAIQVAFSIFVITEAWLVPLEGWFVDRFGPRLIVAAGGLLVAAAWAINSLANSLPLLYLGAALGGIGVGCVYGTCVGNALKWFPDRRGLAPASPPRASESVRHSPSSRSRTSSVPVATRRRSCGSVWARA